MYKLYFLNVLLNDSNHTIVLVDFLEAHFQYCQVKL